jgi:hypothetical protein
MTKSGRERLMLQWRFSASISKPLCNKAENKPQLKSRLLVDQSTIDDWLLDGNGKHGEA